MPNKVSREYRVWQSSEEEALRQGVKKHGLGAWEVIRTDPEFAVLFCRSGVQLKDKWRNLVKFKHVTQADIQSLQRRTSGPWSKKHSLYGQPQGLFTASGPTSQRARACSLSRRQAHTSARPCSPASPREASTRPSRRAACPRTYAYGSASSSSMDEDSGDDRHVKRACMPDPPQHGCLVHTADSNAASGDRVDCVCGADRDDGQMMIECERCQTWAHVHCLQELMRHDPERHHYSLENYYCRDCQQAGHHQPNSSQGTLYHPPDHPHPHPSSTPPTSPLSPPPTSFRPALRTRPPASPLDADSDCSEALYQPRYPPSTNPPRWPYPSSPPAAAAAPPNPLSWPARGRRSAYRRRRPSATATHTTNNWGGMLHSIMGSPPRPLHPRKVKIEVKDDTTAHSDADSLSRPHPATSPHAHHLSTPHHTIHTPKPHPTPRTTLTHSMSLLKRPSADSPSRTPKSAPPKPTPRIPFPNLNHPTSPLSRPPTTRAPQFALLPHVLGLNPSPSPPPKSCHHASPKHPKPTRSKTPRRTRTKGPPNPLARTPSGTLDGLSVLANAAVKVEPSGAGDEDGSAAAGLYALWRATPDPSGQGRAATPAAGNDEQEAGDTSMWELQQASTSCPSTSPFCTRSLTPILLPECLSPGPDPLSQMPPQTDIPPPSEPLPSTSSTATQYTFLPVDDPPALFNPMSPFDPVPATTYPPAPASPHTTALPSIRLPSQNPPTLSAFVPAYPSCSSSIPTPTTAVHLYYPHPQPFFHLSQRAGSLPNLPLLPPITESTLPWPPAKSPFITTTNTSQPHSQSPLSPCAAPTLHRSFSIPNPPPTSAYLHHTPIFILQHPLQPPTHPLSSLSTPSPPSSLPTLHIPQPRRLLHTSSPSPSPSLTPRHGLHSPTAHSGLCSPSPPVTVLHSPCPTPDPDTPMNDAMDGPGLKAPTPHPDLLDVPIPPAAHDMVIMQAELQPTSLHAMLS